MNKLLLSIGFVFILILNLTAQEKEKRLTDAEQFSLKSGLLIEKEFIDVGKLKGMKIQVLKFKDLASGTSKCALRFEKQTSSGSSIGTIDIDEVEDLSKAIQTLKTNIFPTTRSNYTEITFKSKTDFEAGAYYANNKWSAYLRIDRYGDGSVFLTVDDFDSLLAMLGQAKQQMQ